jgi:hypothetical protein
MEPEVLIDYTGCDAGRARGEWHPRALDRPFT